ncbi:hypothetical protein HYX04_04990 [Candidatus Woesearchaeota archaeon]|nr:hypothetical protein [Candidatus Woesearchaeota archaeon]
MIQVRDSKRLEFYHSLIQGQYSHLLSDIPHLKALDLDDIVQSYPLASKFIKDGKALTEETDEHAYRRLESRLVGYLLGYETPYDGKAGINNINNTRVLILEYINLIRDNFKTKPHRVARLKYAIMRAFIQKVGLGAWRYIAKDELVYYRVADVNLKRDRSKLVELKEEPAVR